MTTCAWTRRIAEVENFSEVEAIAAAMSLLSFVMSLPYGHVVPGGNEVEVLGREFWLIREA